MPRGMTNGKRFDDIEVALKDFDRVSDAIQMMQTMEIFELFRRAQEWKFLDW